VTVAHYLRVQDGKSRVKLHSQLPMRHYCYATSLISE
jgi:hypothetical protein